MTGSQSENPTLRQPETTRTGAHAAAGAAGDETHQVPGTSEVPGTWWAVFRTDDPTGWPRSAGRALVQWLSSQARGPAVILIFAFALLYAFTLDNGLRSGELAGGDLITHQYAQVQGRFSNAPGYPLYTLGGWLWFRAGRLILGSGSNPIPILSSYSTFWALVALWLLYRLILEVTAAGPAAAIPRHRWLIAWLVAAFYGVSYFFWYYAVTTEQYTSSVAWTLAVFLLAFRWERTGRDRCLLGLALLAGIGLAHQVTVLFAIPALLWFVLAAERLVGGGQRLLRRPRLIAMALGLAAAPLLSYVFVYVRGAQHPEWRGVGQWADTWRWFWSFVSTQQGQSELTWAFTPFLTAEFPSLIWREMTVPGLVIGLLGLLALRGPARAASQRRAAAIYATLTIYLVFCWVDRLGNWYQVIMPAYALLAIGIAAAAVWAWDQGEAVSRRASHGKALYASAIRTMLVLALLGLALYRGIVSFPQADSRDRPDDTGLAAGWAILADDPPPGTAIFAAQDEALAIDYLTDIWGQRPDVRVVTSGEARRRLAHDAALAVTISVLPLAAAEISPDAHLSALGSTLVRMQRMPQWDAPADLLPWTHDFGPELRLIGGRVSRQRATGETVVLLVWQTRGAVGSDWSVSVRLTRGGQELAQLDRQHPVHGAYPMTRWSPAEIVADAYAFTLPAGARPDGLMVILYRQTAAGSFINLDAASFPLP